MNHEVYLKAEDYVGRINRLNSFKKDLAECMKDDDDCKRILFPFSDIRSTWYGLIFRFTKKTFDIHKAPVLEPNDLNDDADELYKDLCAVADKWIDIYEKRLEEL